MIKMIKSMMLEHSEEVNTCFLFYPIIMECKDDITPEDMEAYLMAYSVEYLGETEEYENHTLEALTDFFVDETNYLPITKIQNVNKIITIDLREYILEVEEESIYDNSYNKITPADGKYMYSVEFNEKDPESTEFYIMLMVDDEEGSASEVFYADEEDFKEIYNILNSIIKDTKDESLLLSEFESYLHNFNRLDSVFVFDDVNQEPTMLFPYPFLNEEA